MKEKCYIKKNLEERYYIKKKLQDFIENFLGHSNHNRYGKVINNEWQYMTINDLPIRISSFEYNNADGFSIPHHNFARIETIQGKIFKKFYLLCYIEFPEFLEHGEICILNDKLSTKAFKELSIKLEKYFRKMQKEVSKIENKLNETDKKLFKEDMLCIENKILNNTTTK